MAIGSAPDSSAIVPSSGSRWARLRCRWSRLRSCPPRRPRHRRTLPRKATPTRTSTIALHMIAPSLRPSDATLAFQRQARMVPGRPPSAIGRIPPQCLALNRTFLNVVELTVLAALGARRDLVYQAALLDPNTAATLPSSEIVELCDELIAAHGDLMPEGIRA